ncbi:MAG: hypothetical protein WBL31_11270 [Ilumatobacteraceae bacterium]
MSKHVVSVSLGSSTRDKSVTLELGGEEIVAERRGVDGDLAAFNRLMRELDGTVDVLSVGGTEIAFHVDGEVLTFRSTAQLIEGVTRTPLVDGAGLKLTLERRVFELAPEAADAITGAAPHFGQAFLNIALDRWGMALAVDDVSDSVVYGDLMFSFGVPVALTSLTAVKRMAKTLVPVAGRMPLKWLYPTGDDQTVREPKFAKHFAASDLICGDFLYIGKHAPDDLTGKTILTNTTTSTNVEWLAASGATMLITTTPRFDGRSFGTNLTEAIITAAVGSDRSLTIDEMNAAIDDLGIRPDVTRF